jgi:tetratricopeptide (TPR) repeat protein
MSNNGVNMISEEDKLIFEKFFLLKEARMFNEAFNLLDSIKRKYPKNYKMFFLLGTVLYLARRYNEAVIFLKKSILLNAKHELSSLSLFHSLVNLGKIHTAVNELRRYLLLNPKIKKNHKLALSEIYSNINNFSTSEQNLIKKTYSEFLNKNKKK